MGFTMILSLLSGVALFLFGMSLMGEGLKRVAGSKLELTLYRLTNTPFKGVLLGRVVTAIIRSSSATSVRVVGVVNSGMMQVSQAIGIIMGANIGTSITGWVLCITYVGGSAGLAQLLSTATISSVVAIVGIIFKLFVKKESYKSLGEIMLGFSILMLGMQTMSGAVSPLKESARFINALTMFSNPIAGIIAGALLTAVLQSASASVGILQALSATGAIHFSTALPITMGIGVGASCPVLLSSIGTNKNGKRTALVYLLIDSFGMVFWSIVFYSVHAFVKFPFMEMIMGPVQIAMLNTIFRTVNISLLLPLIKFIERFVFWAVREDSEEEDNDKDREEMADFELLEERFLAYPAIAISQSHRAMNGMAKKARKNILRAFALMDGYTKDKYQKIQDKEILIDTYEDRIGTYLMQLTGKEMTVAQNKELTKFLHTIGDFERLGDHAVNISEAAEELYEKKLAFSEEAQYEMELLEKAVQEIVDLTVNAFCENNLETSIKVEPLREIISVMCDELKLRHIARLKNGVCKLKQSFAFNDLLNNLERIAAHCSNVAVAMIELEAEEFDTHEYLRSVKGLKNATYSRQLEIYEKKYEIKKNKKSKKKAAVK